MKYLILLLIIGSLSCSEAKANQKEDVGNLIQCSWSDIYEACFCYANLVGSSMAVLTWVPEKVCIKARNK